MKSLKDFIPTLLMIASITLLLVLQGFWLRNSYEKAYFDFTRDTNNLFRTTVLALWDSVLFRSLESVPNDSVLMKAEHSFFTQRIDTVRLAAEKHGAVKGQPKTNLSKVQIFITSRSPKKDSINLLLRPVTSRILDKKMLGNFTFRVNTDSLPVDSIRYHFQKAMTDAGIPATFKVVHSSLHTIPEELEGLHRTMLKQNEGAAEKEKATHLFTNSVHSEWVRVDPENRYATVLGDFRPSLLREITPQILFSVFLTLLTSAAFIIMYRSIRSQQRLMQMKNDFIGNITHELKTPVTTVGVALEALKNFKGLENPKLTTEYLEIAQNELNRLSILTDKILNTAVFENNGVDFQPEALELDKVISQILNSMKLVVEKHGAEIQFEKIGSDFTMNGGTVQLTNVIYNLLDNGLKYSSGPPLILVELKDLQDNIRLVVKDNGIGIPSAFKKKIFEKFFRVPTGDVHNIKGYGLGLSYVASIIKGHYGTIEVDSVPGQGSTFTITLPKGANVPKK